MQYVQWTIHRTYIYDKSYHITCLHLSDTFFPASSNDLARNKPATQSSTHNNYVADNAVDGNSQTFSLTTSENNPYWSVDLGMSTFIDHLYIAIYYSRGEIYFVK